MAVSYSKKCCVFFKAAHDIHRQQILELLRLHGQLNASNIIKHLKLSQPTIAHHLKILHQAELIFAQKQGKEVVYSINEKSIISCCGDFIHRFASGENSK